MSGAAAGGDLTGTYPNPTLGTSGVGASTYGDGTHVSQVTFDAKGRATSASSVAITGAAPTGSAGGSLAGTFPNPTIADSGVGASSYGSSSAVGTFTVGLDGRLTAAGNVTITGVAPGGSAGGDLTGTFPNPTLVATAVSAGSYGDGTHVPALTVDAKGRLTAVTSTTITGAAPTGSAGGDLTGTFPNPTLVATGTAGTYGDATHFPVVTTDSKGRVTTVTTNQAAGGMTGFATPTVPVGYTAGAGTATTGVRSDATLVMPAIITATAGFENYWGSLTHAGTVTVDFNGASRSSTLTTTGNLTLAWSNLTTNRAIRLLILQGQSSNVTLTLPSGSHGYYGSTLSNGWHILTAECITGAVNSNVWVSTSSDGTY